MLELYLDGLILSSPTVANRLFNYFYFHATCLIDLDSRFELFYLSQPLMFASSRF